MLRDAEPQSIRLADYQPPEWLVDTVHLDVSLHPTQTRVTSRLALRRNPKGTAGAPVVLDGDGLTLVRVAIDDQPVAGTAYQATPDVFTLPNPPSDSFTLEIETLVDPTANTQLMGLYRSSGNYCTQCEPEGFRRITYFPDRPDVLSVYTTRIEAGREEAPVLLSNGNLEKGGPLESDPSRHYAVWHDPWPKPSYLFALVGGKLAKVADHFVTRSGKPVELGIYVEEGKEKRAGYAMDALKRSMRWDEENFGREYDLDVFNIVAVSDFNMGAMENKGLNVFNDKYVLATPQTATDADYAGIEGVIAHEYFHNWTGNRITCRDWFQLCLKEGLTVFRDQEFSADERSRPVKRISDVRVLKAAQFSEDAGPLAHPVRPQTYREINNFYTATVYQKGAEVVRMLKTLLGPAGFRAGMDVYFQNHDGEAATIENFLTSFAEATGRNLSQFALWYEQAGTPLLKIQGAYDEAAGTYRLDVSQSIPATPGQTVKQPMVIPLAIGLLGPDGKDLPLTLGNSPLENGVLEITQAEQSFVFTGIPARPVPSLNRGFSAPVNIESNLCQKDRVFLAAHDSDPFNRFDALQGLALDLLKEGARAGELPSAEPLIHAMRRILLDHGLDPAFKAQALALPGEGEVARELGQDVDPDAIHTARLALRHAIGQALEEEFRTAYKDMTCEEAFKPDAASAGRRALRNLALDYLAITASHEGITRALAQFRVADNMTDRFAALCVLSQHDVEERETALTSFHDQFQNDPLVIDKWLTLQAQIPAANTLDRVRKLMAHPAFSLNNPNRVRALIGAFAHGNPTQFNRPDGAGYAFVADIVLQLDKTNPQVASRLLSSFRSWRQLEPARRDQAEAALRRVADTSGLSADVADIAIRSLA
ncbi:aminopeptidase N [Xanthobacter sp. TB0136]|uniref:aminopeptidase N n=1 Tax=Xanthobacter sp. TB0136 TaxID=3459177 RepID=UPI004039D076